jgi:hypothetical protein
MVPAERTVTVAIGHGKRAARSIDAFLRNRAGNEQVPPHSNVISGTLVLHSAERPQLKWGDRPRGRAFPVVIRMKGDC